MSPRVRSRDLRVHHIGTRKQWAFEGSNNCDDGLVEWCTDTVGEFTTDNGFDLKQWTMNTTKLNGDFGPDYWFVEYPVEGQTDPKDSRTPFSFDDYNLSQRAAAISNPSRPYVSVPQFIGEFRDFPKLLRDLPGLLKRNGDSLIEKVAKGHLSWKFALKPLFSDLAKIASFQDSVNQRIRMLEKLREEKSLRRRASLGDDRHSDVEEGVLLQSAGAWVVATRHDDYRQLVWATTRWQLNEGHIIPTDQKEVALWAKNLAAGTTTKSAAIAAWELIPWSWLVDWFLPVGDYLAANNNSVPVRCTSICLMRYTSCLSTYRMTYTSPGLFLKGFHWRREERKWRQVVSPTILLLPPLADLSFLTGGQLSILGSLAILKKGRY